MKTKKDQNLLWDNAQVKAFAKRAVEAFGKDFFRHVDDNVKRALLDAEILGILAGNYDEARFSPANIRAIRDAVYAVYGLDE